MKNFTILFIILMYALTLFGQQEELKQLTKEDQATDVERGIMKLNFLPFSLSYEFKVDRQMTMMVEPSFNFNWSDNGLFYFSPTVTFFYRYYYNFDKRNLKGKRTAKNSVNFVGAAMLFSFWNAAWSAQLSSDDYIRYFGAGPVWGIQRNYKKHFSLGINLGPIISYGNQGFRPDAIAYITLGFWLGK
jgi:hypothetical protein